jgi:hypothetical protein
VSGWVANEVNCSQKDNQWREGMMPISYLHKITKPAEEREARGHSILFSIVPVDKTFVFGH